ncbi:MAG: M4 family metallopeptidase, partial [Ruminococcus flavefaciens]|nr:M4 family metallopeptidase [Ruminococcus flavefaciens]
MGSKKRTVGIFIVVIVVLLGFAGSLLVYRNNLSSENKKNNSNNNTAQSLSSAPSGISIENFYDKPITDENVALDSIEVNRDKLGYSDKNFTFKYDKTSSSKTAYHFDLYYKDIPVYGGGSRRGVSVITYHDNSPDVLITGVSDSQKITKVNTTSKITEDEALEIAKETLGENFSEYNVSTNLKQVKICPKLIIYETQGEYVLSYRIISNFYICIINAKNGEVITSHSTMVANASEYEGQNGDIHQIFYDDYKDEDYDIKDMLWNKDKNIIISDYPIRFMTLSDIQYGNNKSAVDAMANTYRAVEYFESKFGISFDSTMCIINEDEKWINNASGIGAEDEYGSYALIRIGERTDKNKAQYSAYLDIVAHEYTHAVTDIKAFGSDSDGYSSDSRYYEMNALMEAYSDIFGELVEQEYTGSNDWKNNDRNIKNPQCYKYSERYIGSNDDGGAHYNSTIISHVAYLMSKDHKSIKHSSYGSTKNLLDYNQLAQLWYGSLEYLKKTEFMDFSDCRYAVEKSARSLIEQGVLVEDNLKIIEQAFNEVEVISNPTRRGLTDSMEIIKDKNTIVVPIEDETQST